MNKEIEIEEDTVAEMVPASNPQSRHMDEALNTNASFDVRRDSKADVAEKLINELTLNQLPEEEKTVADKHVSYREERKQEPLIE